MFLSEDLIKVSQSKRDLVEYLRVDGSGVGSRIWVEERELEEVSKHSVLEPVKPSDERGAAAGFEEGVWHPRRVEE